MQISSEVGVLGLGCFLVFRSQWFLSGSVKIPLAGQYQAYSFILGKARQGRRPAPRMSSLSCCDWSERSIPVECAIVSMESRVNLLVHLSSSSTAVSRDRCKLLRWNPIVFLTCLCCIIYTYIYICSYIHICIKLHVDSIAFSKVVYILFNTKLTCFLGCFCSFSRGDYPGM